GAVCTLPATEQQLWVGRLRPASFSGAMADSPSLESIEQKLKEALEELEALRRNDGLANTGKARRDIQSMDISLISVSKAQAAVPPRVVVTRQLRPAVSEIQAVQNALAKTRHIRILSSSRPRPQRVQWTSMELVNALGVEPALPRPVIPEPGPEPPVPPASAPPPLPSSATQPIEPAPRRRPPPPPVPPNAVTIQIPDVRDPELPDPRNILKCLQHKMHKVPPERPGRPHGGIWANKAAWREANVNVWEWLSALQSNNFHSANGATYTRLCELAQHFRFGKQRSHANRAFNMICAHCGVELDMFLGHNRNDGRFVCQMDLLLQSFVYLIDPDEPKLIYPKPPALPKPHGPPCPTGAPPPPALPGPQGPPGPTGHPCTVETRWPGSCLISSPPPDASSTASTHVWW
ncbi:MAG: hypothetical protein ACPIOQ_51550, partial [Promethearchaeia archaeon]